MMGLQCLLCMLILGNVGFKNWYFLMLGKHANIGERLLSKRYNLVFKNSIYNPKKGSNICRRFRCNRISRGLMVTDKWTKTLSKRTNQGWNLPSDIPIVDRGLSTVDCWLSTVYCRPLILDCGLVTKDCGPWTMDRGPWTVDRGPWTVDRGSLTVDRRPWIMDRGQWTMDRGPWTVDLSYYAVWRNYS